MNANAASLGEQLARTDRANPKGRILCGGPDTNAVCFGINPNSGAATDFTGFFDDLPDFGQTTTKMNSSVTPEGTAAPEPANLGLLTAAGAMFLGFGVFRKRRFGRQS